MRKPCDNRRTNTGIYKEFWQCCCLRKKKWHKGCRSFYFEIVKLQTKNKAKRGMGIHFEGQPLVLGALEKFKTTRTRRILYCT